MSALVAVCLGSSFGKWPVVHLPNKRLTNPYQVSDSEDASLGFRTTNDTRKSLMSLIRQERAVPA